MARTTSRRNRSWSGTSKTPRSTKSSASYLGKSRMFPPMPTCWPMFNATCAMLRTVQGFSRGMRTVWRMKCLRSHSSLPSLGPSPASIIALSYSRRPGPALFQTNVSEDVSSKGDSFPHSALPSPRDSLFIRATDCTCSKSWYTVPGVRPRRAWTTAAMSSSMTASSARSLAAFDLLRPGR